METGSLFRRQSFTNRLPIWIIPVAVLFGIWSIGAAQFNGYAGDDYRYLVAAQCIADHFWCVSTDHWARRAPIVLPVAGSIRLFGLSQISVWLAPAIYAITSLALLTVLVVRRFGTWPAIIGSTALILTPAFSELTPALGIDVAEFSFLVLATFALERIWATGRAGWSAIFGIAAAMAVMCRPTALAALPIFAVAFLVLRLELRAFIIAAIAFSAILAAEACIYLYLTGDPFLTWKLSLRHTSIQSNHLVGADIRQSPILNVEFIRGWKPAAGIEAHWTVKGLINLAAHPGVFLTFYWTVVLGVVAAFKRRMPAGHARLILWLVAASAVYFALLTYVLAIDPEPRMFVSIIAIMCVILGVCVAAMSNGIFLVLVVAALGTIAFRGVTASFDRLDFAPVNARAMAIEKRSGMGIPVHPVTVKGLALSPDVRMIPIGDATSRRMLVIGAGGCGAVKAWAGLPGWTIEREVMTHRRVPAAIDWLRQNKLFVNGVVDPTLCVLSARK